MQMNYLVQQKQENDQYKRIINSLEDALIVIQDEQLRFANHIVKNLFRKQGLSKK